MRDPGIVVRSRRGPVRRRRLGGEQRDDRDVCEGGL